MRSFLRTPIPALTLALIVCLLAVGCVLTSRDQVPQAEASEPSGPFPAPRSVRDDLVTRHRFPRLRPEMEYWTT